jgi:hypothetical protein
MLLFPTAAPPHRLVTDTAAAQFETDHYAIASTATLAQTRKMGEAVESLHAAYLGFFADSLPARPADAKKLSLRLYKDQAEFKAHNTSSPWAEAFYRRPTCYAYFAIDEANPTQWMLHEATHQLNREVARFVLAKWLDEGLASYFGASQIREHVLVPGSMDMHAYPLWWLPSLALSGNPQTDFAAGKLVPLRALISGSGGPDINRHFNAYYIGYWSLTHFLVHYRDGRYAAGFRQLIAAGGSLQDFEKFIGPVERIQGEWYGYLREKIADPGNPEVVFVLE